MTAPWYRWEGDSLHLLLTIQPRASRDQLVGPHGDRFKVRITAPPVEGQANAHLTRMLAKAFGVPPGQVTIAGGARSRDKHVVIQAPRKRPVPLARA